MKKGSPAQVVIAAKRLTQQLGITSIVLQHNHETSSEIYNSYPETRRFQDDEKQFVQPLLEMKVFPSLVVQKLNEKTGNYFFCSSMTAGHSMIFILFHFMIFHSSGFKSSPGSLSFELITGKRIIAKDLQNLKDVNNRREGADQLMEVIEECRSKEHVKVIPVTDENQELQILFIQTQHMQQVFSFFPEVLLLDATYRTNNLRMPLFVFVVEDGSGRSHVVAYAFVASEQQHVVTHLLETFVKDNARAADTNVVVIDKDFTEIAAIREAFPSQPAVQLCQFHVIKAFRAAAGLVSNSVEERERLVSSFCEMLHAPTPDKFEEARMEFVRYANEEARKYFEKNWATIPEMWARHLCDQVFTAGNNTTNRVESHNGKLKNVLTSSGKLHEAVRALLKISSSMLHEARHQTALLQTCEFYSYTASGEVEKTCFKELTPYACALINKEQRKMKESPPEVRQSEPDVYSVKSAFGCHEVSLKEQTCTCTTFSKMGLLCRHFLAVCQQSNKTPDLQKAVKARWFKSHQLGFMAESARKAASEASREETDVTEVLTMPGPSYERVNRNQRFNFAMRTFKAIADHLADCPAAVFTTRLEFLENVHSSWMQGQDVVASIASD